MSTNQEQPPAGARDAVSVAMADEALFSQADEDTGMLIDFMGMGNTDRLPEARRIMIAALEAALTGKADGAKPENPLAFLCDCGEAPDHMPYGYRWCVKNGGRHEVAATDGAYSPATQPAATGASNVVLDGEEEESHHGE